MGYILNQNGGTGHDWCRKKNAKKQRGSQTPGRAKGENCHASGWEKSMCKRNRSWKHKGYKAWVENITRKADKYGG